MTATEKHARFIMNGFKTTNPTLAQIETALSMIRDGDLIHVDLIAAWVMSQDAEYRGKLMNDLAELAAEEEHMERQRAGWPITATSHEPVEGYSTYLIKIRGFV